MKDRRKTPRGEDRRSPYRFLLEKLGLRQFPNRQPPIHGGRPGLKAF